MIYELKKIDYFNFQIIDLKIKNQKYIIKNGYSRIIR